MKATYASAIATATLKGNNLEIALQDKELADLENPTYTLSYRQGRGMVTFASGNLENLKVKLANAPTVGKEYTLTVVSDNYQDITTTVTAEAAEASEYTYVYAGLSWAEYWANENVQAAGSAESSSEIDAKGESDKGAFGYAGATYKFQAADANIVKPDSGEISTTDLEAAIAKAEALKEADYTAESWAAMQTELQEAKDELKDKHSQAAVDEATDKLNAALVKKSTDTTNGGKDNNGQTTGGQTNNSQSDKTNGTEKPAGTAGTAKAVKTGDPASVLNWLGLAFSSLGAGGFAWKRKRK
nr:penicillin-binding Tp47 domain A-containing protein [uncultured Mediterraneibacter sp.]